jgi:hypothetical protein
MHFTNVLLAATGLLSVTCSANPTPLQEEKGLKHKSWINYTTVAGFFLQDEESTNPTGFDYVSFAAALFYSYSKREKANRAP